MHLISQFRNSSLPVKFTVIFGGLALGLAFMATSYYKTIAAGDETLTKQQELSSFAGLVDATVINLLQARQHEQDFESSKRLQTLDVFNKSMSQVDANIAQIHDLLRSAEDRQIAAQMQNHLEAYQDKLYDAAEVAVEIGLTPKQGLLKQLQEKMQVIAQIAVKTKDEKLNDIFFNLRGLTNAYIGSRSSGVSADEVIVMQKNFLDKVNRSEAPYEDVSKMMVQTISLQQTFKLLSDTIEEERRLYSESEVAADALQPIMQQLLAIKARYQSQDNEAYVGDKRQTFALFAVSIMLTLLSLGVVVLVIKRGVLAPVARIQQTVSDVTQGNFDSRSRLETEDEFGHLGAALDTLLDERVSGMLQKEEENQRINQSIIQLLQDIFRLSQRDLTVKLPVAEDITGAISDSVNRLVESMNEVLGNVQNVTAQVAGTSGLVKEQSSTVINHAKQEQAEIRETLIELSNAVNSIRQISELAQISNDASLKAIDTSDNAVITVSHTIASIDKIRATIHEAEKRIKRLGERSQEIGGIVNLINHISERTHILSLNASMHAASAGEAGRGLMVVVDEVQRLAENSREATAEIENLVKNIQIETADTVNVINTVIADVVEGSRLAGLAGESMRETRKTTEMLVSSVQSIAANSVEQAGVVERLRYRAGKISATTKATYEQMEQQTQLSQQLVAASEDLQSAIEVFKLAAA